MVEDRLEQWWSKQLQGWRSFPHYWGKFLIYLVYEVLVRNYQEFRNKENKIGIITLRLIKKGSERR